MFGINAGDELTTQAVTVSLPRTAVDSFAEGITTSAFVNVVMNATQNFVVKVTDMKTAGTPEDSSSQTAEVTAEVAAAGPSYTVDIPASIAMGTLSAEKDNTYDYEVKVTADSLGSGKVEVTTAATGELRSGENILAFANSFGTQSVVSTDTLTGTITVKAADVQNAASGNYTGTANFTINYYTGE